MEKDQQQSILFAIGINHKTAPIEVREQIYVSESEIPALIAELKKTLSEAVVLSTCNRTEIYGVTTRTDLDLEFYKDLLINFKGAAGTVRPEHFFGLVSCAACQQLFRVATSVDSKIIGDMQILGQLRGAYAVAHRYRATGRIINQLFQRAFKVGKRARTETKLHRGAVSVSLAAVELAAKTFRSLDDKKVLIIGAGDMARLTAECLIKKRVRKIFISNRTRAHADDLLASLQSTHHFEGEVLDFERLKEHLNETDIVISSTSSPEPILRQADFAGQLNKILLIDIAVPRDIEPEVGQMKMVVLKNIDDLQAIVDENYQRRMADLPLAKRIIMDEMSDFLIWYYSLPLLPDVLQAGGRPDTITEKEILRVKEFLLQNVSQLHKMAMQSGAENFAGHVEVVNRLVAMKKAALGARFEVEA